MKYLIYFTSVCIFIVVLIYQITIFDFKSICQSSKLLFLQPLQWCLDFEVFLLFYKFSFFLFGHLVRF